MCESRARLDDPWPYAFSALCASFAEGRYSQVSKDFTAITGARKPWGELKAFCAKEMASLLPGIAAAISLLFLITQPWAQQPSGPPEQAAPGDVNIFNYGDVDKTCIQWTDGCRNCSRGTGQLPNCSNIGIACQPQDKVTCFGRTSDGAKPDDAKR